MIRSLDTTTTVCPAELAHFVLRVRDLEASLAWYQTLLGVKVVSRNESIAFMTYDHEHHRLALVQTSVKEEASPGAAGLDHVAYTVRNLGELLGTYRRLEASGILPVWCINHGPTTSMYYQDPDGNRVEFQSENFATTDELNAWMHSDAFKKNPIGVGFDAEKLIARYEKGDPIEELVAQGSAS